MSHDLIYLLLICALLIVPRALQRFRLPSQLTCFGFGIVLILAWPTVQHNDAVHLLATFGIASLFLYAGLEVDLRQLQQGLRPLLTYIGVRVFTLVLVAGLAWQFLGLAWQPAALLALALLTSSTGFIVDSLDRFDMSADERFWVTNQSIAGELLALAAMFVVLQAADPLQLAGSTTVLLAMVVAIPLLYLALGRWITPHAPGSEFSLLVMVGLGAAYVTDKLGVEYLLGAFIAGLIARLLRPRLPALASEHNLHAVKLFSSFFVPFYFFANGAKVPTGALTWEALLIGLGLTAVLLPARLGVVWAQRRWLCGDSAHSSLRIAVSLMPTLIFTLVLATILRERFALSDALFGGLLLYAALNTLLPSLVLRTAFDIAPMPLEEAPAAPVPPAEAGVRPPL
ncbi:cation:proton antiporter [Lysobacter cavernae]|uniref:Cation:proton antiporter n=1 Tax=Lysobacter cavernae TaxID=1685901 RepID=A0ABV7RPP3_9GAMM